jgi:hypothetical protein
VHKDLLAQATVLASMDPRRPKQANLRRAISSAYYALYHFLVDEACRDLLGAHRDKRRYRDALARGFDHSSMKDACSTFWGGNLPKSIAAILASPFVVPPDLQHVAATFVRAQEKRHVADYDRAARFQRSDVDAFIREVQSAVARYERITDANLRQFFLACLLAWRTLVKR